MVTAAPLCCCHCGGSQRWNCAIVLVVSSPGDTMVAAVPRRWVLMSLWWCDCCHCGNVVTCHYGRCGATVVGTAVTVVVSLWWKCVNLVPLRCPCGGYYCHCGVTTVGLCRCGSTAPLWCHYDLCGATVAALCRCGGTVVTRVPLLCHYGHCGAT